MSVCATAPVRVRVRVLVLVRVVLLLVRVRLPIRLLVPILEFVNRARDITSINTSILHVHCYCY